MRPQYEATRRRAFSLLEVGMACADRGDPGSAQIFFDLAIRRFDESGDSWNADVARARAQKLKEAGAPALSV